MVHAVKMQVEVFLSRAAQDLFSRYGDRARIPPRRDHITNCQDTFYTNCQDTFYLSPGFTRRRPVGTLAGRPQDFPPRLLVIVVPIPDPRSPTSPIFDHQASVGAPPCSRRTRDGLLVDLGRLLQAIETKTDDGTSDGASSSTIERLCAS
jgi:hypothetical protein